MIILLPRLPFSEKVAIPCSARQASKANKNVYIPIIDYITLKYEIHTFFTIEQLCRCELFR